MEELTPEQLVAVAGVLAVGIADNLTETQLATVTNLIQLVASNLLSITAQRAINKGKGIVVPDGELIL